MHHSIFTRVFISIIVTATIVLAIAETINYVQLKQSFDTFASKQVIVLKQIGQAVTVREDYTLPADFEAFINDYRVSMAQHNLFSFGIGVTVAIIAGLIVSTQITHPISQLRKTINKVTATGYTIRATQSGALEIQDLIAEFNRLIQELENQDKIRQELIADISHELKTPITKVRGQLEGIIDGVYPLTNKTIKQTLTNIEQLEYLIQALYEANRLNPQDVDLHLKSCNVKNIAQASIAGFSGKPINFKVDIDPKLTVKADPNRLHQIIDNLIANAYKFTPKGTISVKATPKQIIIKDTGIGIAATHLPHIFERLYRADKSRSRDTGGLGLGLYIVERLVSLHGWKIQVNSQKNQGTTFTINVKS
jgi:signal transduction histidine kinase